MHVIETQANTFFLDLPWQATPPLGLVTPLPSPRGRVPGTCENLPLGKSNKKIINLLSLHIDWDPCPAGRRPSADGDRASQQSREGPIKVHGVHATQDYLHTRGQTGRTGKL